ncbi:MAG: hypothetical protein E6J84_15060 [Deltaproteobacteria bacterium]|nr:MAG: hypothetical protein E6J84_15060 [Deltaproteobacteria bacterium]
MSVLLHRLSRIATPATPKRQPAEASHEQDESGLPRFVVAEFERYLRCGILANGFARVRCVDCGDELL